MFGTSVRDHRFSKGRGETGREYTRKERKGRGGRGGDGPPETAYSRLLF